MPFTSLACAGIIPSLLNSGHPVQLHTYRGFLTAHSQFLLLSHGDPKRDRVENRLGRDRWHFYPLGREGMH
jgi:hypothetical protein